MLDVGALYVDHHAAVYRYLRRQAPYLDRTVIEDLAADTFERALKAAPRYEDRGHRPLTWLCDIARRRLIDHKRSHAVSRTVSLEAEASPWVEPHTAVWTPEGEIVERDFVAWALTHLTESQQRVVRARYWDDRKFGGMAELGNENTVKHLDRRARASLRPYLEMSA